MSAGGLLIGSEIGQAYEVYLDTVQFSYDPLREAIAEIHAGYACCQLY